MLNPFVIKKYASLIFSGMFSTICFFIGVQFYGLLWGLGLLFVGLLVSVLLGVVLLKNPFSLLLEGKGILVLDWTSTGVIYPFIVKVNPPFIKGNDRGKEINDVFDRSAVNMLASPVMNSTGADINDGGISFKLDQKDFNSARFGLYHYPTLIYNSQLETFLTKDFLSEQEKSSFAEHGILLLNRRMEELSKDIKNFGRYVVELTKPMAKIFSNMWFWIIIIIVIGIIAMLFLPGLMGGVQNAMSSGIEGIDTTQVITKR